MRLHVISLPHTQTNTNGTNLACAYTQKVVKFCPMMLNQGYEVVLYGTDQNSAECTEFVSCLTTERQNALLESYEWYKRGALFGVDWNESLPFWQEFNTNVIRELTARIQPQDVVCLITAADGIISAFPNHQIVEFGVGYQGTDSRTHHVYESYAWMHACYGHHQGAASADGSFYDQVIPNYFELGDFPVRHKKQDYFLFMSRMIQRKGYQIAIQACERAGSKLLIAGIGGELEEAEASPNVELVGFADTKLRGELLSNARAVFMPTLYLEPFGGVAVEALLCGTPVISTDWGAFPELIEQGVDGYRCRSMHEFVEAMIDVGTLSPQKIARRARARWSTDTVGAQYDKYFTHLQTLYGDGFYQ